MDPAEHPGIHDRLAVRPDDLAFHGDARRSTAFTLCHLLAIAVRFRIAGDERVGVNALASRLPIKEQALVELMEHVIVSGRLDGQIARARQDRELERSVGHGLDRTAPGWGRTVIRGPVGMVRHDRGRNRSAGAFLGDLAAHHHASGQRQVDRMRDRPLRPDDTFGCAQVGLPVGRISDHDAWQVRSGIHAEPPLGIGYGRGRGHPHAVPVVEPVRPPPGHAGPACRCRHRSRDR